MNILSISDLSANEILKLISDAMQFKNGKISKIERPIANIFIEPSTRTLMSFQRAQNKLGMEIYNFSPEKSSLTKGETLDDTILNLYAMGMKVFVVRSSEPHYWKNITNKDIAIINAGDGVINHPSQALLDAMTIFEEFGTIENLKIAIVGDIEHSRVFKSNVDLFSKFNSTVVGYSDKEIKSITDEIENYDVVMFLRIQHERHDKKYNISNYNELYGLNENNISKMKNNSIFMHPGPVNWDVEISSNLQHHPKNRILRQVENGVFIRMAMIEKVCKNM